jgi:hypothetical protein
MKRQAFYDKLQGYNPDIDQNFVVLLYCYPIKLTKKSVLLYIDDRIKAKFIAFSILRLDRETNYIYIWDKAYREILQGETKNVKF